MSLVDAGQYSSLEESGENGSRAHVRRCLCVRRSSCLLAVYTAFYALFLVAGAFIFNFLEQPRENQLRQDIQLNIDRFLTDHPCVPESSLNSLLEEIIHASNLGVSASRNTNTTTPNWSFGQSLFFSATVVTTIGYGHITPLTPEGKLFCLAFALTGIPLTLVLLSGFVERMMVPSTQALQWLGSQLGHVSPPLRVRLLHLGLVGVLVVGLFLLVPAAIFSQLEEDWSFLDSLYYCFISLTTVGLGDYIPGDMPGQKWRMLYKVATTAYLLVGLVMMMWFLTVFAEVPQLNLGVVFMHQTDETTSDPEKMRLAGPASVPKYTQQMKETRRDSGTSSRGVTPVQTSK